MGRELGMEDTGLDSIRAANDGLISQTVKLRSIGVREANPVLGPGSLCPSQGTCLHPLARLGQTSFKISLISLAFLWAPPSARSSSVSVSQPFLSLWLSRFSPPAPTQDFLQSHPLSGPL